MFVSKLPRPAGKVIWMTSISPLSLSLTLRSWKGRTVWFSRIDEGEPKKDTTGAAACIEADAQSSKTKMSAKQRSAAVLAPRLAGTLAPPLVPIPHRDTPHCVERDS